MGAGGRDFHDFNVAFREDPTVRVVAFTAAQIPGLEGRVYPPELAGPLYPEGIPVEPEERLSELVRQHGVSEVVLAYSDLSHAEVMHHASRALAAGADFRLLGPDSTMLEASRPVIAVTAARTGCGKSQTSRRIATLLQSAGLRVALVRHPMPYGDLLRMRVQRFSSLADIDASDPTVEEREEYEEPVRLGITVWAGTDYADVLRGAEGEADVIVWDGGNNDFPFIRPDLHVCVVDPLRSGHELGYHPGETNLRLADVVLVNKLDSAEEDDVERLLSNIATVNPEATVIRAESPVELEPGPSISGLRALVVEDGPTLTHGGMAFGAGTVAARAEGAKVVDPRPYAVGSIADVFERYRTVGAVLPAMGYGAEQLAELGETIESVPCDVVISGTPIDLSRLIRTTHPIRRARYELRELGRPTLEDVIAPILRLAGSSPGLRS